MTWKNTIVINSKFNFPHESKTVDLQCDSFESNNFNCLILIRLSFIFQDKSLVTIIISFKLFNEKKKWLNEIKIFL